MSVRRFLLLLPLLVSGCAEPLFHDLGGNEVRFSGLEGRWVVINYWAIWCQPCREEIPELNELAMREAEAVQLIGVNFDLPGAAELRAQAESLGIEFPVLMEDPALALGYARPEVLPTTILIDPDGEVVARLEGPQSADSILAAIGAR